MQGRQLAQYRFLLERLDAASLNVEQPQELIHMIAQGL